jgi:hypothetical protein
LLQYGPYLTVLGVKMMIVHDKIDSTIIIGTISLLELSLRTSVLIFNGLQNRNASVAIPCLKHSPVHVFGTVLLRMGLLWSAVCFEFERVTVPHSAQ